MKKYLIISSILIAIVLLFDLCYYEFGLFIDFEPDKKVTTFIKTSEKDILMKTDGKYKPFEIKGVDLGSGIPGHFATDYAIDKETYLRWFRQIKEMGANTIRVYTILNDDFYQAFYEYNKNNKDPLYLIHGLWVNDYIQYSRREAYDKEFLGQFLNDSKKLVDIIHGKRQMALGNYAGTGGTGFFFKDISPWVIGYILGVEWEDYTVAFTDNIDVEKSSYKGKYMYTSNDSTAFEAMLAQVGDKIIEYESKRYKEQRLVAFANWPTTDPFYHSQDYGQSAVYKVAAIDVEHILSTKKVLSGQFASYHVYPYYPDFLNHQSEYKDYVDENGKRNTYRAYLEMLNQHHSMPVVISEFGIPASRGMAHMDENTGRNQGRMSEQEQGEALVESYQDIRKAGIDNAIIFTWQDEWFKRTWNTMHAVNLTKTPYFSDYQTNEQFFGLLSFDPGKEKSVCYVDGDVKEWKKKDIVFQKNGITIYNKYDEKFVYFRIHKKDYNGEKLYMPIDITPKSGAKKSKEQNVSFERNADFLLVLDGKDNSTLLVQERYNTLKANFGYELTQTNSFLNPPKKNSTKFEKIELLLREILIKEVIDENDRSEKIITPAVTYDTGKLLHGNANPDSKDYNSIADFMIQGDDIEIRLPWQLLNFSDPSNMKIHDDYYENYGIEELGIDKMYVGIGTGEETISMKKIPLKGWKRNVTYHERLKKSYDMIKKIWKDSES